MTYIFSSTPVSGSWIYSLLFCSLCTISACAPNGVDCVDECSTESMPFSGRWEMEVGTLAFFEDSEMVTIPASVYPNEVTELFYIDPQEGSFLAAVILNLDFISETRVEVQNSTYIEQNGSVIDTYDMDILSWSYDEEYIYLSGTDFFVPAFYEQIREGEEEILILEWDRDFPGFQDESCMLQLTLKKTYER